MPRAMQELTLKIILKVTLERYHRTGSHFTRPESDGGWSQ